MLCWCCSQVIKKQSQKKQNKRSFLKVHAAIAADLAWLASGFSLPQAVKCWLHCADPCLLWAQTTVKTVNYQHLMPTRYSLDVDLKTVFTNEAYSSRENLRTACLVSLTAHSAGFAFNFSALMLAVSWHLCLQQGLLTRDFASLHRRRALLEAFVGKLNTSCSFQSPFQAWNKDVQSLSVFLHAFMLT